MRSPVSTTRFASATRTGSWCQKQIRAGVRRLGGIACLAAAGSIALIPVLATGDLSKRVGPIAWLAVVPVELAFGFLAIPFLVTGLVLISPRLAVEPVRGRCMAAREERRRLAQQRHGTGVLTSGDLTGRSSPDLVANRRAHAPELQDRYGYDVLGLSAAAATAVLAAVIVWFV